MDISHLNKQQQLAVCSTEGKVRVIAGAGTGKTLVLVNRYAYLVNVLGIDPHNILCLTFTNKAAQEMRSRLSDMFGIDIKGSFVGTLHGFCLNFLRGNYAQVGLSEGFTIMDREDCVALAKEFLKEKRGAKSFVDEISDWKYSVKNDYIKIINNARKQGKNDSFSNPKCQFVCRQQEMNMADYDDLLLYTYSILTSNKEICQEWSEKFDYIMVDEAQDCSMVDWCIINKLSSVTGNLFVVGDPDQCIYQWRGAAPRYLVEFKPDIDVILNENYRSTQSILNVANNLISHNKLRVPKDLFSIKAKGTKPELFFYSFHPSFFKDLKKYPQAAEEFDCYIAYLRGNFNEAFQQCIEQGLCMKECDSFLFSTFLCLRLEDIKNSIVCQKEKVRGIPNFVITNLLLGCCTDKGRIVLESV